jgi:hypothetical protein
MDPSISLQKQRSADGGGSSFEFPDEKGEHGGDRGQVKQGMQRVRRKPTKDRKAKNIISNASPNG